MEPGAVMRLHELAGDAELNGRVVRLVAWQEDRGRWECSVRGRDGLTRICVRPRNLHEVPPSEHLVVGLALSPALVARGVAVAHVTPIVALAAERHGNGAAVAVYECILAGRHEGLLPRVEERHVACVLTCADLSAGLRGALAQTLSGLPGMASMGRLLDTGVSLATCGTGEVLVHSSTGWGAAEELADACVRIIFGEICQGCTRRVGGDGEHAALPCGHRVHARCIPSLLPSSCRHELCTPLLRCGVCARPAVALRTTPVSPWIFCPAADAAASAVSSLIRSNSPARICFRRAPSSRRAATSDSRHRFRSAASSFSRSFFIKSFILRSCSIIFPSSFHSFSLTREFQLYFLTYHLLKLKDN